MHLIYLSISSCKQATNVVYSTNNNCVKQVFTCLTWTRKNNCSKKLKKKSATVLLMCEDKLKENFKWHRLTATQVRPLHNMQTTFCKQILLIIYLLFPDGQTCSHFIVPIFDSLTLLPIWISLFQITELCSHGSLMEKKVVHKRDMHINRKWDLLTHRLNKKGLHLKSTLNRVFSLT